MIDLLFYIIFFGFASISFFWGLRIVKSWYWLKESRENWSPGKQRGVFVVIPLLDEVGRIENTVKYFFKNFGYLENFHLILVTTEKEYEILKERGSNLSQITNTVDVAKGLERTDSSIKVYHYPYSDGKMAHQLNYAIRSIIQEGISENSFFAVYNADSRPHRKTFDWVFEQADRNSIKVFQQYGDYLKNISDFRGFGGSILMAAAVWQTRWAIGFEIFNALKQLKFRNKKKSNFNYPLNYCVGHGLFFTKDIFLKLKGFDEKTHNEDAILGLELSYDQELIMPVPYFDESDSPDAIKSLYLQKSSWFFGPLQAFGYYKSISTKRKIKESANKMRLFFLSTKLFSHALYWILGPTLFFLSLGLAISGANFFLIILFFVEAILFLTMPNFLSWLVVRDDNDKNKNYRKIYSFGFLLGAIPCYFLHGLSAYRTLAQTIISFISGKPIKKQKTSMLAKI